MIIHLIISYLTKISLLVNLILIRFLRVFIFIFIKFYILYWVSLTASSSTTLVDDVLICKYICCSKLIIILKGFSLSIILKRLRLHLWLNSFQNRFIKNNFTLLIYIKINLFFVWRLLLWRIIKFILKICWYTLLWLIFIISFYNFWIIFKNLNCLR